jgi:membrane-associated protease RseP (regulator of RpoE activity)
MATVKTVTVTRSADLATDANVGEVKAFRIRGSFDATEKGIEKFVASLRKLGLSPDLVSVVEVNDDVKPAGATGGNEVRNWALAQKDENGEPMFKVAPRGRLSLEILEAYEDAHAVSGS